MSEDIAWEVEKLADELGVDRKKSIGEVAKELNIETHVIRFWEENFPQIKPEIGAGKRRYYYNKQVKVLKKIKRFLYEEGYTVAGLQKLLKRRKEDAHKEEDLETIIDAPQLQQPQEFDTNIDPNAKLVNFSNIKVPTIDPRVSKIIEQSVKNIRENLEKLKLVNGGL